MLQGDEDRDDCLLMLRLVDVDAVLVMQGQHLLADDSNDVPGIVIQFKVQAQDIALQLPAQAFDIGDVLDDVEQLVGQFKLLTVRHRDIMPLVKSPELALYMRYILAVSGDNVRLVMDREELALGIVYGILMLIRDCDVVMQGDDPGRGKKRTDRFTEARHVVYVRGLTCFTETMVFRKYTI